MNHVMNHLDVAARVDKGLVRESNQDVAQIAAHLGLVLVADGMGGHEQGEVASSLAAEAVCSWFERLGGLDEQLEETERRLVHAFAAANTTVREQYSASPSRRMGTTLVAAAIAGARAVVAHVGDSRCYLVRDGVGECLTHDHSYAADLRRHGFEDSSELRAAADSYQNILTRCIGGHDEVVVDTKAIELKPGDALVLCSDGLWGGVGTDSIARMVAKAQSADQACAALIGAAWQAGGLDNIGVAVVRVL